MFPFVMIAETQHKMRKFFIVAVLLLSICLGLLIISYQHTIILSLILTLFFAAFTFLESCQPSWVSKIAPVGSKGTAMGIFSSCQFFGIFIGGVLGGIIFHKFNITGVLTFCTVLAFLWFLVTLIMAEPTYLNTRVYKLEKITSQLAEKLNKIIAIEEGLYESVICLEENAIYIKIDKKKFDEKLFIQKINLIK
jgi:MFS family permease